MVGRFKPLIKPRGRAASPGARGFTDTPTSSDSSIDERSPAFRSLPRSVRKRLLREGMVEQPQEKEQVVMVAEQPVTTRRGKSLIKGETLEARREPLRKTVLERGELRRNPEKQLERDIKKAEERRKREDVRQRRVETFASLITGGGGITTREREEIGAKRRGEVGFQAERITSAALGAGPGLGAELGKTFETVSFAARAERLPGGKEAVKKEVKAGEAKTLRALGIKESRVERFEDTGKRPNVLQLGETRKGRSVLLGAGIFGLFGAKFRTKPRTQTIKIKQPVKVSKPPKVTVKGKLAEQTATRITSKGTTSATEATIRLKVGKKTIDVKAAGKELAKDGKVVSRIKFEAPTPKGPARAIQRGRGIRKTKGDQTRTLEAVDTTILKPGKKPTKTESLVGTKGRRVLEEKGLGRTESVSVSIDKSGRVRTIQKGITKETAKVPDPVFKDASIIFTKSQFKTTSGKGAPKVAKTVKGATDIRPKRVSLVPGSKIPRIPKVPKIPRAPKVAPKLKAPKSKVKSPTTTTIGQKTQLGAIELGKALGKPTTKTKFRTFSVTGKVSKAVKPPIIIPNVRTTLNEIVGSAAKPKTDITPKQIPKDAPKTRPLIEPIIKTDPDITTDTGTRIRTVPDIITVPDTRTPPVTVPKVPTPPPPPPPIIIPPFFIPPGGGDQSRKKKKKKGKGRGRQFTPSISAIIRNITGKRPKIVTGVRERPITRRKVRF